MAYDIGSLKFTVKADGVSSVRATLKDLGGDATKAAAEVKKLTDSLSGSLTKSSSSGSNAMMGMKNNVAMAVTGMNQALELGKKALDGLIAAFKFVEGAAKEMRIDEAFKNVVDSMGASADEMLATMKKMTKGTVEESELQQKAISGILGGMTTEQATKAVDIATIAARKIGISTSEALDRVSTALEVKQTKTLVKMGLITKEQAQNLNDLISKGKETGEMFDLVSANADIMKSKLKPSDDTLMAIQQMKTEWTELGNELGKLIAPVFGAMARELTNILTHLKNVITKMSEMRGELLQIIKDAVTAGVSEDELYAAPGSTAKELRVKAKAKEDSGEGTNTEAETRHAAQNAETRARELQAEVLLAIARKQQEEAWAQARLEFIKAQGVRIIALNKQFTDVLLQGRKESITHEYEIEKMGETDILTLKAYSLKESMRMRKAESDAAISGAEDVRNAALKTLEAEIVLKKATGDKKFNEEAFRQGKTAEIQATYDAAISAAETQVRIEETLNEQRMTNARQLYDITMLLNSGYEYRNALENQNLEAKRKETALVNEISRMERAGFISSQEAAQKRVDIAKGELDRLNQVRDSILGEMGPEANLKLDASMKKVNAEIDATQENLKEFQFVVDEMTGTFMSGFERGVQSMLASSKTMAQMGYELSKNMTQAMAEPFNTLFDDILSNKLKSFNDYFTLFANNILKTWYNMLSQMMAQQAMGGLSKMFGGFFGGGGGGGIESFGANEILTWASMHSGGVVGETNSGTRRLPASMLYSAPRLHNGLGGDENPAILQKGERVIPKGGGSTPPQVTVQIKNESSQPIQGEQGSMKFDGEGYVIGIILKDMNSYGPLYHAMGRR